MCIGALQQMCDQSVFFFFFFWFLGVARASRQPPRGSAPTLSAFISESAPTPVASYDFTGEGWRWLAPFGAKVKLR